MDEYDLDISIQHKPVMHVNDLYTLIYYHWALDTETFPH